MAWPNYRITPNRRQGGVVLSKDGHWGNLPFATGEAAKAHAIQDARPGGYTIERHDLP